MSVCAFVHGGRNDGCVQMVGCIVSGVNRCAGMVVGACRVWCVNVKWFIFHCDQLSCIVQHFVSMWHTERVVETQCELKLNVQTHGESLLDGGYGCLVFYNSCTCSLTTAEKSRHPHNILRTCDTEEDNSSVWP